MSGIQFTDGKGKSFESYEDFVGMVQEMIGGAVEPAAAAANHSVDIVWLIVSASLVFFMQTGFALVEVGSVSMKNTKNILTKNLFDACIGALTFYFFGYAFAYGEQNRYIGAENFALSSVRGSEEEKAAGMYYKGYDYAFFLFQWAFAATAATIVSGAVAERCKMVAYFVYSFFLTGFIYPVVVHWGWGNGWASAFVPEDDRLFGTGVIDFAGSTVVHMVGGVTALIGAAFLGPRHNRYQNGKLRYLPQQSTTFQTVGVLILWLGWYGFNCGSTLTMTGSAADVAGLVAVTTTISATTAGIVATIMGWVIDNTIDIARTNNGILGGLVSITAGCSVMNPELAFVTGLIGGVIYFGSSKLLEKLKIDDVVDASPVHLFCGAWGTIAAGLFAHPENVAVAYGTGSCGLFFKCNGNGIWQFLANLVFVLAVTIWTSIFAFAIFAILKVAKRLRVSLETEKIGLDIAEHGGAAYEMNPYRRGGSLERGRAPSVLNEMFGATATTAMDRVVVNSEAK